MKAILGERLEGPAARAVRVCVELEASDPRDFIASLGSWFIRAPGQSAFWDRYCVGIVHLRPIEGVKPAVIRVAGATHELFLLAYDPALDPQPDNPKSWRPLFPVNLEEQVTLPDDESAVKLLRLCVLEIVNGRLWAEPPLSGQVDPWRDVLRATALHFWGHPEKGGTVQ